MTIEQKNSSKKEGGTLGAISTLFGKKTTHTDLTNAPESVLANHQEEILEKKSAAMVGLGITYSEDAAAERLGISSDDVRWMRKELLKAGEDFTREGGFVRIADRGVGKIEAELALGTTLICTGTNLSNPNLVLARFPGQMQTMRVRVADSSSWCKGMLLRGCIATENHTIWICEVRPRFKGRI